MKKLSPLLCLLLIACTSTGQPSPCKTGYDNIPNFAFVNGMPIMIGFIPVCKDKV